MILWIFNLGNYYQIGNKCMYTLDLYAQDCTYGRRLYARFVHTVSECMHVNVHTVEECTYLLSGSYQLTGSNCTYIL